MIRAWLFQSQQTGLCCCLLLFRAFAFQFSVFSPRSYFWRVDFSRFCYFHFHFHFPAVAPAKTQSADPEMEHRPNSRRRKPMQHGIITLLIVLLALSSEVSSSSSSSTSSATAEVDLRARVGSTKTSTADSNAGVSSHVASHTRSLGRDPRQKRGLRASAPRRNRSTTRSSSVSQKKVHAAKVEEQQRQLQDYDYEGKVHDFEDVISSLADSRPMEWTGMQWLCLVVLLMVLSTLFSCICGACCGCCRPRRYGYSGGGYYGGRGRGGGGGCCSDIFWCFCCFEWCCRDCQDVDACCDAYRGM